ncbi:MAG: flagellar basal-body rod protein FlgG [Myxococcaceae bacterium]|nr:flagellar basal-body rod protein FlgG [Myxococcaceae bacterium]
MLRSLYTAASGMDAQQLKMDVTANNLANASTTGFKKERAEFEDLMAEQLAAPGAPGAATPGAPSPLEVGLGVRAAATTGGMAQGELVGTQNPFDVAIEGAGYLAVRQPGGELAYTRAGNLRVDATGRLVTAHGELVDPEITVPTDALSVVINRDGTVQARTPGKDTLEDLGTLELTLFPNPGGLTSQGRNLLAPSAASGEPMRVKPGEQGAGFLSQGYLENSNVQAVEEMVDLISTQRAYELNSKVIQTADQMLQRLTSLR